MIRGKYRDVLAAVLAGLALAALGCASEEQRVARHVAEAERLAEEGDHRSALIELRAALQLQPKSAELNVKLAEIYEALGKIPQATFFHGEAYRLDPSFTEAGLTHARALFGTEPEAAEDLIDEIIEREPANVLARVSRAELLLVQGDPEAALAAAYTATELDPESVLAARTVGAVQRAIIRQKLLSEESVPDAVHQKAYDAYERSRSLAESADLERGGSWFDRKEQALVYSQWSGHAADARRAFEEAFALAEAQDDPAGMRAVSREAQHFAETTPDRDFLLWSLEARVQVAPDDAAAWRRLAEVSGQSDGSSEEVWQRAFSENADAIVLHQAYARDLFDRGEVEAAFAHLAGLPPELAGSPQVGESVVRLHLLDQDVPAARAEVERLRRDHPDAPLTRIASARLALHEGRLDAALETLRTLSGNVDSAKVYRLLAVAEARSGNAESALAAAERAIEMQPAASAAPYKIRMTFLGMKEDWPGVLRTWRALRRLDFPVDEQQQLVRIRALYEMGYAEQARRVLDHLLDQESTFTLNLVLLFVQYEGSTQVERANELLERAVETWPDNWRPVRALVVRELRMQQPERALARLERYEAGAERGMPGLRAQVYSVLDRMEEAEAAAIEAFELDPRPRTAIPLLVDILVANGKADEAVRRAEAAREAGSLTADGHWKLGQLYRERGDFERALARLEAAHEQQPSWAAPMNDLAFVLAETGTDLDRAVELARMSKAQAPESHAVADTLGYAYHRKGLHEPAAFEFRSAIELARAEGIQKADYQYHLGLALQALGREAEARQAFEEALRIEPDHAAATQAAASVGGDRPGA